MIYPLSLEFCLVLVGLSLVAAHAFALLQPRTTQAWLIAFPRSKVMGWIMMTIAAVWAEVLVTIIDLGEFTNWRTRLQILIPIAYVLTIRFVGEFLAARALGIVVLLAAEPLLESAFLRPEVSRLWLVSLAYVWIVFALFWIGMPYTLRDQIGWVMRSPQRWKLAVGGGIAYGLVLLIVRFTL